MAKQNFELNWLHIVAVSIWFISVLCRLEEKAKNKIVIVTVIVNATENTCVNICI